MLFSLVRQDHIHLTAMCVCTFVQTYIRHFDLDVYYKFCLGVHTPCALDILYCVWQLCAHLVGVVDGAAALQRFCSTTSLLSLSLFCPSPNPPSTLSSQA